MKNIGVGVVGCGFVGRGAHIPAIGSIEGAHLAAVADPDANRRSKAMTKHRAKAGYEDYNDLVKDPDVDIVVVAVPTPLHAKAALAAIESGKHVLCEMPLAVSLDEAGEMIGAAHRQGVLLMPGLTFRFTPNFVKAKAMLDAGEIGSPLAVLYREFIPASDLAEQWPAASWMWNVEESGGPLYTLAVWSIDLVRWLFGAEIVGVNAAVKYTVLEKFGGTFGYDASASLQMSNGVVGSMQYSGSVTQPASSSALEVVGDSTHVIKAEGHDKVTLLGENPTQTIWDVKQPGAGMWGHLQQDDYFVRCVRAGETPTITPEDGLKAMEIASLIAHASAD
ncbi:MAG: Gfo/Idh/MocA family oxidoreductase [Pirellulaceae bacterium]|nr:Gfo/Idh/MocA family oxidoreductase [Pirellulaceae bacterium]